MNFGWFGWALCGAFFVLFAGIFSAFLPDLLRAWRRRDRA